MKCHVQLSKNQHHYPRLKKKNHWIFELGSEMSVAHPKKLSQVPLPQVKYLLKTLKPLANISVKEYQGSWYDANNILLKLNAI